MDRRTILFTIFTSLATTVNTLLHVTGCAVASASLKRRMILYLKLMEFHGPSARSRQSLINYTVYGWEPLPLVLFKQKRYSGIVCL